MYSCIIHRYHKKKPSSQGFRPFVWNCNQDNADHADQRHSGMTMHMANVDQALGTAKKVQEYISVGFDTCIEVASDLAEHEKEHGSSGSGAFGDFRKVMMEYCEMEKKMNDAVAAAEAVKTVVKDGELEEGASMAELFDSKMAELTKEFPNGNFEEHHRVKEFDQRIEEVGSGVEGAETGTLVTQEVDDEEIEWMQAEVNTKCPYTGKEMVRPVTNKHCKHNYDKEGILQFIKDRRHRAKCPVAGCGNAKPLEESDLEDNAELKKIIAKKNRQVVKKKR